MFLFLCIWMKSLSFDEDFLVVNSSNAVKGGEIILLFACSLKFTINVFSSSKKKVVWLVCDQGSEWIRIAKKLN